MLMLEEETQRKLSQGGDRSEIQTSLEILLKSVNQQLEPHEKLAFLVIPKNPWTMENGLLTPTMKIRRQKIEDKYADLFETWADQKSLIVWE